MNEELVNHQLSTHDKRLNNHAKRLDKLEQEGAALKIEIKNLCENLKSLTSVMKWFIGIWVSTLLGFFIYTIQNNFLK
ncbi:hemolysin XhlA family protein [Clostridium cadaveris]|uniref:hemolysin XhlA family protein n=1 Tax=Clostridium cadaveris TaxID=1529 RepID=UPI0039A28A80